MGELPVSSCQKSSQMFVWLPSCVFLMFFLGVTFAICCGPLFAKKMVELLLGPFGIRLDPVERLLVGGKVFVFPVRLLERTIRHKFKHGHAQVHSQKKCPT